MGLAPVNSLSLISGFPVMHFCMCVGQTTSALLVPVYVPTTFVGLYNFLPIVSNRSEIVGLSCRHMGLLLLWCSFYAAGHFLSCAGTYSTCLFAYSYITSHTTLLCWHLCMFPGQGAISASVGSAPLQEHHHSQPETGRGSVSTPSQSSSFYNTDAANPTGTPTHTGLLSFFLIMRSSPCTTHPLKDIAQTSMIYAEWGKITTDGKEKLRLEKEVELFFLPRDLTGSNLSVNTECSHLPMTTRYSLHPVCVCLRVWVSVYVEGCLC